MYRGLINKWACSNLQQTCDKLNNNFSTIHKSTILWAYYLPDILTTDVIYHKNWENLPREEPHQKSKLNPDIYSKTRLQIIRWNKSREASTENEEKQTGLNVGKRTTWYDRSLTTIILYSMTNLSHPSYYTKQKGQTEKDWTSEKQWQGMAGLSHPR